MDYNILTVGDCISKLEHEGKAVIIENGYIIGFIEEEDNFTRGVFRSKYYTTGWTWYVIWQEVFYIYIIFYIKSERSSVHFLSLIFVC